jgi:hypothetical protein
VTFASPLISVTEAVITITVSNFLIPAHIAPPFLTLALGGGEWPASHTGCLTPGERAPSTNRIAGWVSFIAGLDAVEKRKILLLPGI